MGLVTLGTQGAMAADEGGLDSIKTLVEQLRTASERTCGTDEPPCINETGQLIKLPASEAATDVICSTPEARCTHDTDGNLTLQFANEELSGEELKDATATLQEAIQMMESIIEAAEDITDKMTTPNGSLLTTIMGQLQTAGQRTCGTDEPPCMDATNGIIKLQASSVEELTTLSQEISAVGQLIKTLRDAGIEIQDMEVEVSLELSNLPTN